MVFLNLSIGEGLNQLTDIKWLLANTVFDFDVKKHEKKHMVGACVRAMEERWAEAEMS